MPRYGAIKDFTDGSVGIICGRLLLAPTSGDGVLGTASFCFAVRRLMLSVRLHEACILERISASFYRADETLTKKREKIGWGNVRKVYDRLHKLLAERVAQLKLTSKESKNYWSQIFLRRVLLESFRGRAVAHTIDNLRTHITPSSNLDTLPEASR